MVNLKHKLTVDDLIVEYMVFKVKNGYEPSFLASEFMNFLHFFESKMVVDDALYDKEELFKRFFERKLKSDWNIPHMDIIFSKKDNDYLIKANYKLSGYDLSIINTYFMDNDFKGQVNKIRSIIAQYLANYPKREIDNSKEILEQNLLVGKYIAAQIITNIWDSFVDKYIQNHTWPKQCKDMDKYLFEIDLAEIIGIKSIKKELTELYRVLSKRIASLYQQDKALEICSREMEYLAYENYKLLIEGYEDVINIAFGKYGKSLQIDLSTLTFKESHKIDGFYDWDEDPIIQTTTTKVENENVKKLVRNLDNAK